MRYQALEAVGMTDNPVDHVSAVARAQGTLAVLIDERIMFLCVIETLHQVFIRSPAPVSIDRVNEVLPVSGRTVEVDHDDCVSISREQLRVPAIGPVVSPCTLRPAMDKEFHGIFFGGLEIRRFDESAFHPVSMSACE